MKNYFKQLLLIVVLFLCSTTTNAHSFEVDGIFYEHLPNNEVSVTFRTLDNIFEMPDFPSYEGDIVIPKTVTYNEVTYTVKNIGANAFYDCNKLNSITIPPTIEIIGNNAFYGCSKLKSITLPASVRIIGENAFDECNDLEAVHVDSIEQWFNFDFNGQNPLVYAHNLYVKGNLVTEVTIPKMGYIKNNILRGWSGRKIIIQEGTHSIGYSAFASCRNLEEVIIPEGVKCLYEGCFAYCEKLKNIKLPNSLVRIMTDAFRLCNSISDITITADTVSWVAFGCKIKNLTISNKVKFIASDAFYSHDSLNIVVEEGNKVYDSRDNCNAIIRTKDNSLIFASQNTVIPSSVTTIAYYAFKYSKGLTKVKLTEGIREIQPQAFVNCQELKEIVIPKTLRYIDYYAFDNCPNITSMTSYIPADSINKVEHLINIPVNFNLCTLYVPKGDKDTYEAYYAQYGVNFKEIIEMDNTGIEEVEYENCFNKNEYIYNLNGQIVTDVPKGKIYIQNGIKRLRK